MVHPISQEATFRRVMEVLLNVEHPNVIKMLHIFEDPLTTTKMMITMYADVFNVLP